MDLSLELLFFLFFFCDLSNLFLILELSEEFMFTNLAGGWLPHVKIAKKSEKSSTIRRIWSIFMASWLDNVGHTAFVDPWAPGARLMDSESPGMAISTWALNPIFPRCFFKDR